MPRPPTEVGEKSMCFENLMWGPLMNLQIVLSISFLYSFLGRGRMVAMCVSLESNNIFVMFTFAVLDSFVVDHIPISVFIALIAFSQLTFSLSRLPVRYMPNSLKGFGCRKIPVLGSILGSSSAFPNRVYFVFNTFVCNPERAWN